MEQIDPSILAELSNDTEEMGQVVLHILYNAPAHSFMNKDLAHNLPFDQHSRPQKRSCSHRKYLFISQLDAHFPRGTISFYPHIFRTSQGLYCFDFIEVCETEGGHLKPEEFTETIPTSISLKCYKSGLKLTPSFARVSI